MNLANWRSSPVYLAVRDIFASEDPPFRNRLKAVLHTSDRDYTVFKILSEEIVKDYSKSMMEDIRLTCSIPLGDYITLVYPNKDNLEMTVTRTPMKARGDSNNGKKNIQQIKYKCLFEPINPSFTSSEISNYDQATLNNSQFVTVYFRLMDRNAEPLRVKMTQGVFRGIGPEEMIKAILLSESQQILVDGKPAAEGLDIVKPDKTKAISQVVLSSGTHMCEVPTMIQENYDGVYKYGIGTFFQRYNGVPMWFVYPLFDFDRFDGREERDVAIFYSAPPKFTQGAERTYRVNPGVLEVVVTTDKHQINVSEIKQLNEGVGFRLMDTDAFMKKPAIIDADGEPVGARANLNREVNLLERKDGLNYVPVIKNFATNPYHETSKIASRTHTLLHFGWDNADETLIYPGMPMKFCYMEDNQYRELKGTILGLQAFRIREGNQIENDRFSTKCVISVATELNTQLPTYDGEKSFDPAAT